MKFANMPKATIGLIVLLACFHLMDDGAAQGIGGTVIGLSNCPENPGDVCQGNNPSSVLFGGPFKPIIPAPSLNKRVIPPLSKTKKSPPLILPASYHVNPPKPKGKEGSGAKPKILNSY